MTVRRVRIYARAKDRLLVCCCVRAEARAELNSVVACAVVDADKIGAEEVRLSTYACQMGIHVCSGADTVQTGAHRQQLSCKNLRLECERALC